MSGPAPVRARARSLTASIVVGMILVPLSAIAAVFIVSPGRADEQPAVTDETTLTVTTEPTDSAQPSLASDLRAACGPKGTHLVELETEGSATEIQLAALDALRPICEAAGNPLPPGPAPIVPLTKTVYVQAAPTTPTSPPTVSQSEESNDDEQWDEEDEDDDNGESEHEDHDEDEGDDD